MRSILKLDVDDPQLYDVILNTSSAPLDTLAAVVIDLAHAVARSCSEDSRILLKDACIASQVRAALMAHPKIGRAPFEITSTKGAVTIAGQSLVSPWDSMVRDIAGQIGGVASVRLEVGTLPFVPPPG
jgi:hypothetical protein